jgi:ElaB/YqjD/DUF883 family membrane-anchored ribosome-binding protein
MTTKKPADQAAELRDNAREALEETAEKLSDVQARAAQGLEIGAAKAQQVGKLAQEATTQAKDTANRALDQAAKKIDDLPEAVREPAQRTVSVLRQRPALVLFALVGLFALWRLLSHRNHD